jgi:hypothetical protein
MGDIHNPIDTPLLSALSIVDKNFLHIFYYN